MTPVLLGSAPPMQSTRDLVSGRHGGELVPSGGSCERRAAAGKAGAAKLKILGPSACAAPRRRRYSYALTLRKVCRAGFCRPRHAVGPVHRAALSLFPAPRDMVSGRVSAGGGL